MNIDNEVLRVGRYFGYSRCIKLVVRLVLIILGNY